MILRTEMTRDFATICKSDLHHQKSMDCNLMAQGEAALSLKWHHFIFGLIMCEYAVALSTTIRTSNNSF